MRETRVRRKSVLYSWLLSYVSILLVPIIASIFLHEYSRQIIEQEIREKNTATLRHVRRTMDDYTGLIERLCIQLDLNPRIASLLYSREPLDAADRFTIYLLLRDLRNYFVANNYVSYFYVYFSNNDYVITPQGSMDSVSLFQHRHAGNMKSIETWRTLVRSVHGSGDFVVLPTVNPEYEVTLSNRDTIPGNQIVYLRTLPIVDPGLVLGNVAIILDERALLASLRSVDPNSYGSILVLDDAGQLVASTVSDDLMDDRTFRDLILELEGSGQIIGDDELLVSAVTSQRTGWRFVSVVPGQLVFDRLKTLRLVALITFGLCLVVGVLVAYLFARHNYNPIHEIVEFLLSKSDRAFETKYNEYSLIRSIVQDTLREKEQLDIRLHEHDALLREGRLRALIRADQNTAVALRDDLCHYGLSFIDGTYCILITYCDRDESRGVRDGINAFMVGSVVEEFLTKNGDAASLEIDDMMVCVTAISPAQTFTEVTATIGEAQRFLQDTYGVRFLVSISNVHSGTGELSTAYHEAKEAIEYKLVAKNDSIITYRSIAKTDFPYFYPLDVEQRLISYVSSGDAAAARTVVNDLFDRILKNRSVSMNTAKCFMFDLSSTIMKCVEALAGEAKPAHLISHLRPFEIVTGKSSIEGIRSQFLDTVDLICQYVEGTKKSHNEVLRDELIDFVRRNHGDPNLSLSLVAEEFTMNAAYLSRFFKEQVGVNLSDFVARTRLDHAKKLLAGNNMKLSAVAGMVGYANVDTFIRVFKRVEGITPGRYKDSVHAQEA